MKVVIDNKIPYIAGAFEPYAEVIYCNGAQINKELVIDADALIIRTRTICNAELLEGTSVKFIATATIGFDHIDIDYCKKANIEWTNAPGCNSGSVLQYIASALMHLADKYHFNLCEKTIGIIGVGNVGKKVAHFCHTIGMKVLLNDPPRARIEGNAEFSSLAEIQQQADIITLHTPLNRTEIDCTFHLINETFIQNCKPELWLINSCRGEVVNTKLLTNALASKQIEGAIIDCWENEPNISSKLLEICEIATPHIAGYSKDGKANGTIMSVQAVSRFFKLGIDNWQCQNIENTKSSIINIDTNNKSNLEIIKSAIESTYLIENDSVKLKNNILNFENIRGNYPVRREFSYYTIIGKNISNELANILINIGFKVKTI